METTLIKEILGIIQESFSEEISATASETVLGLEAHIEGKDQFIKVIEEKLKLLKV